MRELARIEGCEPSTISRRVRRIEISRDDPLVDDALSRLSKIQRLTRNGVLKMKDTALISDDRLGREALRVLRRLAEQGACMALAPGMDTAVVVRDTGEGPALRTAVVERPVAEALALRGWVEGSGTGRILRYRITAAGRAELRRLVAEQESRSIPAERTRERASGDPASDPELLANQRAGMAESPLVSLARRRDKTGLPFLSPELVAAGERLREDFELSQTGTSPIEDWSMVLSGEITSATLAVPGNAADAARLRLIQSIEHLGPGLADVALRCCCLVEGLESVERRLGWSARSGKIVLRIALERLKSHYDENADRWSPLIG